MRHHWGIVYSTIICLPFGLKGFRMSNFYSIVAKYKDGTISTVYLNKRIYWKIKTARKHLKGLIQKQVKGEYMNVKYFALMMV